MVLRLKISRRGAGHLGGPSGTPTFSSEVEKGGRDVEPEGGEITLLLQQIRNGDRGAESRLIPLVYHELRRLASGYMRPERSAQSLQTTSLVAETRSRVTTRQAVTGHH